MKSSTCPDSGLECLDLVRLPVVPLCDREVTGFGLEKINRRRSSRLGRGGGRIGEGLQVPTLLKT